MLLEQSSRNGALRQNKIPSSTIYLPVFSGVEQSTIPPVGDPTFTHITERQDAVEGQYVILWKTPVEQVPDDATSASQNTE